jgi:hypothetical protein
MAGWGRGSWEGDWSKTALGGTAASHCRARRLQIKRFAELDGRLAPRLTVAGGYGVAAGKSPNSIGKITLGASSLFLIFVSDSFRLGTVGLLPIVPEEENLGFTFRLVG